MLLNKSLIVTERYMADIFEWVKLSEEDKRVIMKFVSENNIFVREIMRNEFPTLYIGRAPEEVARGWIMITGREKVMNFVNSKG